MGSGFVIAPDGKIATSLHVIRNLDRASVKLANGDVFDRLTVIAYDQRRDLAIVKIPAVDLVVIELADSRNAKLGSTVWALGSSRGCLAQLPEE